MKRGRWASAVWTALVVVLATVALVGITRFMATVHDSFVLGTDDRSEADLPSIPDRTDNAAATPRGGTAATGETPSIGPAAPAPAAPAGRVPASASAVTVLTGQLRQRQLTIPVQGVAASALVPSFASPRGGGSRPHEALDIMAPTGTPVLAVEDGRVAKLFTSDAGGLTIYQFDPSGAVAYYYAHLDRYAPGLAENGAIRRGQVLGYVGATGNADPQAPHLHFAIFQLGPERRWWEGDPIDPYLVLRP